MAKEGELVPQKEVAPKHQKMAKGNGRALSIDSKDDRSVVEVYL